MKKLCIMGSTGSIGTQTLSVAEHLGYRVSVLCAGSNINLLEKQIRRHLPAAACVADKEAAAALRARVADLPVRIEDGEDGLIRLLNEEDIDTAVNGIAGMAGTVPSVEAIKAGKNIVTANKESIVTAWHIIQEEIKKTGVSFLSCDSEHSAVLQCLDQGQKHVRRILLTASGGPFFEKNERELSHMTVADALAHPNWSMGSKITIDCATMMNKGLEIIEAVRLFDLPEDRVDVVIHRESIIHSMVEFNDASVLAQLSHPDMRLPIQYALTYPDRVPSKTNPLDLARIGKFTFFEPTAWAQKAMDLARRAVREGGTATTVLNTANEVAVSRFVKGDIAFTDIVPLVEKALDRFPTVFSPTLDDILEADRTVRERL